MDNPYQDLQINMNIPGQMTLREVTQISRLARSIRGSGIIIEAGSLCGLSSWHWSKNANNNVQIFCVDPWKREPWMIDAVEKALNVGVFGRHLFDEYTKDCDNIIPIQGYSPNALVNWNLPINAYFDDAMHSNPILRTNLQFWTRFIVSGGFVCGHDYCEKWPDVMREANMISQAWGSKLHVCDTFWHIYKP